MSEQPQNYADWLRQMKNLKGGWLGGLVITITLVVSVVGAIYGLAFFPAGSYPKIVLAIPGLLAGAAAFFVLSASLWPLKRPK